MRRLLRSAADVGGSILCHVLECDDALNVFSCKDCLLFPFHRDLYVRGHGYRSNVGSPHLRVTKDDLNSAVCRQVG